MAQGDNEPVDPWPSAPLGGHPGLVDSGYGLTGGLTPDPGAAPGAGSGSRQGGRGPILLGIGAGTLAVILAAVAVSVWWSIGTDSSVGFKQLDQAKFIDVGDPAADSSYTIAAVGPDRASLAWLSSTDGGRVARVATTDLAGAEDGRVVTLGPADRLLAVNALPDLLLVRTERYSPRSQTLFALDPATLEQRWQRPLADEDYYLYYGSFLVLIDPDTRTLRRVELATNAQTWTRQYPDATLMVERTRAEFDAPGDVTGTAFLADDLGRRLIVVDRGVLRVIDPGSGTEQMSVAGVSAGSVSLAYEGVFYTAHRVETGYQVDRYDLASGALPRAVYAGTDPDLRVDRLTPCGPGICVVQESSSDEETTVIALTAGKGTPRWKVRVSRVDELAPLGDGVLIVADSGETHTWIVDGSGKVVYDRADRTGVRVAPGSALLWSQFSTSTASAGLAGFSVADAAELALGTVDEVRPSRCVWSRSYLVCPTEQRLAWWRFAS